MGHASSVTSGLRPVQGVNGGSAQASGPKNQRQGGPENAGDGVLNLDCGEGARWTFLFRHTTAGTICDDQRVASPNSYWWAMLPPAVRNSRGRFCVINFQMGVLMENLDAV